MDGTEVIKLNPFMLCKLAVNEIYGPVLQGEGPDTGRPRVFLRLAGCNLRCEWCDTPYTWNYEKFDKDKEVSIFSVAEVVDRVLKLAEDKVSGLVITGGEPTLQQVSLRELISSLPEWEIELETNGTIVPDHLLPVWDRIRRFNVSPKLSNAGSFTATRLNAKTLMWYVHNASDKVCFKFVCNDVQDVEEVAETVGVLGIPRHLVWIMPQGTVPIEIVARMAMLEAAVLKNGFSMTSRTHILLHGSKRSV